MAYLQNKDFYLEVAKGNVPKHLDYSGWGANEDIDTATVPEDIYLAGGVFIPPTTYRVHNIVSSSVNDTSAGTGARTVHIYGVVSTGLADEIVTLNGVTPVATVNSYSDIYIMFVATAGSGNTNAGQITATAVTDATVTCQINVNSFNSIRKAIRLIPPGYKGYLYEWEAGMEQSTSSSSARVILMTKESGGIFITRSIHSLSNSGNSHEKDTFRVPLKLEAGTWVKCQCTTVSSNNTFIQAGFNLILVQD